MRTTGGSTLVNEIGQPLKMAKLIVEGIHSDWKRGAERHPATEWIPGQEAEILDHHRNTITLLNSNF